MATIQTRYRKNGKPTYKAVIRIGSNPTLTQTFDRLSDARLWIQEHEPDLKKGKRVKDYEASKHTLAELIDRYLNNELKERKSDQDKFKMHLEWWKSQLGGYKLNTIDNILLTE